MNLSLYVMSISFPHDPGAPRACSTDRQTLIAGAGALSAGTWGGRRARVEQRVRELPAGGSTIANSALSHEKAPNT